MKTSPVAAGDVIVVLLELAQSRRGHREKIGSPVKSCVSNKTKPLKPFCSGRDDVSDAVSAGLVL